MKTDEEQPRTDEEQPEDDRTDDRLADDHLAGVEEGAGCTEIWEHLSEQRERASDD